MSGLKPSFQQIGTSHRQVWTLYHHMTLLMGSMLDNLRRLLKQAHTKIIRRDVRQFVLRLICCRTSRQHGYALSKILYPLGASVMSLNLRQ